MSTAHVFDARWFAQHQGRLLWWLNAPLIRIWFRWVLCIAERRPILAIRPDSVTVHEYGLTFSTEFRTHAKYAKRLYYAFRPLWYVLHAWDWLADPFVPALSFGFSTLTVRPDAGDPGAVSVDGYVGRTGVDQTWAAIIAGAGTMHDASGTEAYVFRLMSSTTSGQWQQCYRGLFHFDTSALTSAATITAATLSLRGTDKQDALAVTPNANIYASTVTSNTALADADFQSVGSTAFAATINYASLSAVAYNDFELTAPGLANISKTGVTKFASRNANYDVAASAPTWTSNQFAYVTCYAADRVGTTEDPTLLVTYSLPAPPPTVIRGTPRIEANLSGVWTSLGRDVLAAEGIRTKRGMVANGPLDVVAVSGTLEFALRNDAQNTGSLQGYYSPNHVNCRSGWTFGIPVRLLVTYNAVDYPIWRGRIRTIEPTPGRYLEQRVSVIAQDCMGDLVDTEVRSITPQISQTEVQLLQATIAAMPTDAQPPATSYDTALDTVPVAFDDIEGGAPAMQLVTDVVKSARGKAYAKNDGTFRYTNRQTIGATVSIGAFTDATLHAEDGISVPSSLANVFNRVRVTIHPKTIDAAATTVLFALPVASAATPSTTLVPSGATAFTIWGNYFDPGNTEKPIGGTAQVTPIVVTTDYKAWSLADGTGSDLTANLTITTTAFASSVKFEIANSGAAAYVTKLQIRGKGIYDNTPITSESYTAKTYGDRLLPVDLKYQNSASIAQEFADRWKTLYADLANQAEYLRFNPQASDTVMLHALQREIADVVTVSETMTGLDTVDLAIHGVEFDITEGTSGAWMLCRWKLAPNLTSAQWILSDTTFSVLGTTTILGLA